MPEEETYNEIKNIRVPEEEWEPFKYWTKRRGEAMTGVLRRAIRDYVRDCEKEAKAS